MTRPPLPSDPDFAYYMEHRDEWAAYYRNNLEERKAKMREYYRREWKYLKGQPELVTLRKLQRSNRLFGETREEQANRCTRKMTMLDKVAALRHYAGGGIPMCVRCGEVDVRCLSLDHIDSDGAKARKNGWQGGKMGYRWLRHHHYPPGFVTLCMNCQFRKRHERYEYGGFAAKGKVGKGTGAYPAPTKDELKETAVWRRDTLDDLTGCGRS